MTKTRKPLKCYYCGGIIEDETHDLIIKPIPLHTKRGIVNYKRKFHTDCVSRFVSKLEVEKETKHENSDWEKCYEYAKELLNIGVGQNLDSHCTNRILGTRTGSYYPNGTNVRGLKRGYSFEVILTAMKFSSVQIRHAFDTMQFKDQKHKIDYMMKIVTNNINFVNSKVENKKRAESKLDTVVVSMPNADIPSYSQKGSVKQDKVSDLIKSNTSHEDDLKDLADLFE